jgi:serine/threonine protein kinase
VSDGITQHPTPELLAAFEQGRLNPAAQAKLESHVAACDACCRALRAGPDDTMLLRLRRGSTVFESPAPPTIGYYRTDPGPAGVPDELRDHPRYRIVKRLGVGGMGVVYHAEHRVMERPVALKVINRRLTTNAAVERFRREVKAAARLAHPNIVTAHDAEQAGDVHFLVMEYVDGITLSTLVEKRGPLAVSVACHFIRQAAQGLQHAFEQGMVHRDIKPGNLMLTRKGQVKVLDFGLARLALDPEAEAEALTDSPRPGHSLTMVGTVLGTPDYIAPEQALDSRTADVRADIYSLGCTLYYLLAGETPFPCGTALEKLRYHSDLPAPPIGDKRRDVPGGVVSVLAKMMAKDPPDRYQTPAEVVQALTLFARVSQDDRVPPKTSSPSVELSPPNLSAVSGSEALRVSGAPPSSPSMLVPIPIVMGAILLVLLSVAGYFLLF